MTSLLTYRVVTPRPTRRALAALLLAGAALTSGAAAATTYRIIQLPLPPDTHKEYVRTAFGINEVGGIVGYAYALQDVQIHAIAWSAAPDYTPRWLPDRDAISSHAWRINDAGVIIGGFRFPVPDPNPQQAVMWGVNDVPIRLGEPPGGQTASWAQDINANGTIVGYINNTSLPAFWLTPAAVHFFVRLDGLFNSVEVNALNDFGTVVGTGFTPRNSDRGRAFRLAPGSGVQLLDELPGLNTNSYAIDVNEAGKTVGYINNRSPLNATRALLWNADGSVLDLGELPDGNHVYLAYNINNAGVVAGSFLDVTGHYQTFVWTAATGMQSIVDLIDPDDPLYPLLQSRTAFIDIRDLNDAGLMVGMLTTTPNPDQFDTAYFPIVLVPQP